MSIKLISGTVAEPAGSLEAVAPVQVGVEPPEAISTRTLDRPNRRGSWTLTPAGEDQCRDGNPESIDPAHHRQRAVLHGDA